MLCVLITIPSLRQFNEYTQYNIFNINKKITLNYPTSAAIGFCSKGLKNEFETVMVNEPSVFEPLKVYCIVNREDSDHIMQTSRLICVSTGYTSLDELFT